MTEMTLEREIARLYQLGQTPVEYKSINSTMTMMMLYLNYKYNMNDPSQETIMQDYRKYGLLTRRQKALCEPPFNCAWELDLYYDKKERLIRSNQEDYFAAFYWKIREMIEANPGKKVYCTFDITFHTNDEPTDGHIEIVIFDPLTNTLEHLDSNNLPKQSLRKNREYFACCEISEAIVRKVANTLESEPTYINNHDIYTGYECGVQSLECASDLVTEQEKGGFCLMWTSLFAELALQFSERSMKDIVRTMLKKAKSPRTKVDCMNDYFLFVIRGYTRDVSRQLGISFMNNTDIHDTCVLLSKRIHHRP